MHPRTRELLDYLDAQRTILRAAFDAVPAEARRKEPAGRWSPNAIVEHLAIVDGRIAKLLSKKIAEGRAAGLGPETSADPILPALDVARLIDRSIRFTAPDVLHPAGLDADAAWAALEQATVALRTSVMEGDGLALDAITHPHPGLGPLSLYHWIAFVGAHEARHAAQIRECVEADV
jgi:DinB superfamily